MASPELVSRNPFPDAELSLGTIGEPALIAAEKPLDNTGREAADVKAVGAAGDATAVNSSASSARSSRSASRVGASRASRAPPTPHARRELHRATEQKRRDNLNTAMAELMRALPSSTYDTKAEVLRAAVAYIASLQEQNRQLLLKMSAARDAI